VWLHEVENPLLKLVKLADLHCIDEGGFREVTHNPGNVLKRLKFSVNMVRREFDIG
jgi:hypothetical protein